METDIKGHNNISVIGSSGAIGNALIRQFATRFPDAVIYAFSRSESEKGPANSIHTIIHYDSEISIQAAALIASEKSSLDIVIVATGILHDGLVMPEKSLRDLSSEKFIHSFYVNSILPAIIAKHFIPKLNKDNQAIFAALSARVGSISDNDLGGWYSYRASKAALNMIIKNAAIETARYNKQAIIVGLHPGTVDSNLSKPFQRNIPDSQLFTPNYAAKKLIKVLETLTPESSGKCFAWDGTEIEP